MPKRSNEKRLKLNQQCREALAANICLQVAVGDGLFQERLRCEVGYLGVLAELLSVEGHPHSLDIL
jgi:hypothetical protein